MEQGRLPLLEEFAYEFLENKRHFSEVHADELADAFRSYFRLPPYPSIADLRELCQRLRIPVRALPPGLDASGLNTWSEGAGHEIYVKESVSLSHYESTLCHELREVIEQTFARTHPHYIAIDTHNNKLMNPVSDRFAASLLMAADETKRIVRTYGFDLIGFASERSRSMASIVMRVQELFHGNAADSIFAGIWLFERDWSEREIPEIAMADMRLQHRAHLGGFSLRKDGPAYVRAARAIFPKKGATVDQFEPAAKAFRLRRPYLTLIGMPDLFGNGRFIVGAEPLMQGGLPRRIVVTAVDESFRSAVQPWLVRIGVTSALSAPSAYRLQG